MEIETGEVHLSVRMPIEATAFTEGFALMLAGKDHAEPARIVLDLPGILDRLE